MKPHLIMPMGGAGSRFYRNGYITPKPLIEIKGRPFLYWSAMSICKYVDIADITFVVLQQHIDDFKIDKIIKQNFLDAHIVVLPEILPGPVYTALRGIEKISDDAPIIFNDCDHMFRCSDINKILNIGEFDMDGALLTFESNEPQFSYVRYMKDKIIGTVEKEVVSNHAICGAYLFKNAEIFKNMANVYIKNCPYNECFMSGVYNIMCNNGMVIKDYLLDFHVEFGTPEEYEKAKDSRYFDEIIS